MRNPFGKKIRFVARRKPAGELDGWHSARDAQGFSYGLLVWALALACAWGSPPAYGAENVWLCALGSGDWNDETHWSQGRVPDLSDDVLIDCPEEVTVTVQDVRAEARNVMNANTLQIDQELIALAGTLRNDGTLVLNSRGFIATAIRNHGNFTWLGGTIGVGSPTTNTGTLTISGTSHALFEPLTNDGTIVHTEGVLSMISAGARLRNNGVYEFQSGNILGSVGNNFDLSSTGLLYKSGADLATLGAPFNSTGGAIAVLEGTLVFTGGRGTAHDTTYAVAEDSRLIYRGGGDPFLFTGTQSGVIEGTLRLDTGLFLLGGDDPAGLNFLGTGFQWAGGTLRFSNLRNDGLITILNPGEHLANGNELVNAGTIAVDAGARLRVSGNYTQTAEGTLAVTLGGSEPSQFGSATMAGEARLAGDLAPALAPDYQPSPGNEFAILHYGGLVTMFDTCSGCDLGGGLALDPVYTPDELKLVAIQP